MHFKTKKHLSRGFIFLLIMSFFSTQLFAQKTENEISKTQEELLIIQSPGHLNLNPQLSSYSSEAQILSGLYEGLFSYDPLSLEPIPALASSYKVSRDKKTWTFSIRKNARFANGDPISAQSFYDSWLKLIDPNTNAPFASLLDCIEGVQAYRLGKGDASKVGIQVKNDGSLVIKLVHPTEHLAKILCHHAFSVIHENKTIQSGPFVISQLNKAELRLTKNTFYWDADNVALPSIRFLFSEDQVENTYLFNIGKAHWLADNFDASKLIENDSLVFGTQFGTEYYFFKMHNTSVWNNLKARQALLLALPWEKLREAFYVPATRLLSRLYNYPEIYGVDESDIEEAQAILDSLSLNEEEKHIEISIPDTDYHADQVALFAESWKKIGIRTDIIKIPSYDYYDAVPQSNSDMFTYTWIGDFADPMAFLELFKKGSSLNESRWSSPVYENLLQEATSIHDTKKRYEKLAEAEQELLDSFIVIPLSHPISVNIVDKTVLGGWYENALDLHPLKHLYFKERSPIKNLLIAIN